MNKEMSVEYLAELGRGRRISPVFERAWRDTTGFNPVVTAIRVVEKREGKTRFFLTYFISFLIISFVEFLILGYLGCGKSGIGDSLYQVGIALDLAFFPAFFSAIRFSEVGWGLHDDEREKSLDDFVKSLKSVDGWAAWIEGGSFLVYRDEQEIKLVGTKILIDSMVKIFQLEAEEKAAEFPDVKERIQEKLMGARGALHLRYETLHSLGMVSGGYDGYVKKAKKKMAEAKKLKEAMRVA